MKEALRRCSGKTVVIKYGGAAMKTPELKRCVVEDIALLSTSGAKLVLIHGGGPELTALQEKLGIETKFVDGLRFTGAETVDAALMALCGKVNKELVRLLENEGVKAVGISGIDGGILRCRKQDDPDLGFVGEVARVDNGLIQILLAGGFIPVVSTLGLGDDGLVYNINADTAAGRIAASLVADCFITLSDVPGVLRDMNDGSSLIREIKTEDIDGLIESGVISGGMIPKVRGLAEAIRRGARSASIADGRAPHALGRALAERAAAEGWGPTAQSGVQTKTVDEVLAAPEEGRASAPSTAMGPDGCQGKPAGCSAPGLEAIGTTIL